MKRIISQIEQLYNEVNHSKILIKIQKLVNFIETFKKNFEYFKLKLSKIYY